MLTTRAAVLIDWLSSRIVGALPACGCLSARDVDGRGPRLPDLRHGRLACERDVALLRERGRDADQGRERGENDELAHFFLLRSSVLHRLGRSGSARGRTGTARQYSHASAAQLDRDRRCVVRVGAFPQRSPRVRAMHEDVTPRGQAGDVDRLSLALRDVVVAEARRDPLADSARARASGSALPRSSADVRLSARVS